ncbi:MAG: MFS transporter [Candidatus Peribacteraceae bacterium]|nr:MFS transporter [Candidatus Peribacteraceae bacterium]
MERNLKVLFAVQICMGTQFFLPVFFLFLRENGLSWREIFALEAIFTGSVMLLQIPAGMAADRYGCKKVLTAGFLAGMLSFLVHANGTCFAAFALGNVLLAVLVACHAAGLETITYATLAALGRPTDFRRTIGALFFVSLLTLGLTSVIGGLVGMASLRLTLWLTFPAFAVGALCCNRLVQPPLDKTAHVSLRQALGAVLQPGWRLRTVMAVNIIFLTAVSVLGWIAPAYHLQVGTPEWVLGCSQAAGQMMSSCAARWTHRLETRIDDRVLLLSVAILLGLALGGMILVGGYVGIALLILGRSCFGAISTLGSDLLHRLVNDRVRSRVQALQGACLRAAMVAASLGIGSLLDGEAGLDTVLLLSLALGAVLITTSLVCLNVVWPQKQPV